VGFGLGIDRVPREGRDLARAFASMAAARINVFTLDVYVLVCVPPDDGVLPLLDVSLRERRGEVVTRAYTFAP
jgi:hypothetical protein